MLNFKLMDKIMIRENYLGKFDIPEEVLLTQEEVDALPDNTVVWIIWSGGNGPSKRKISAPVSGGVKWDKKCAVDNVTGKHNVKGGMLDFVGKEKYHTWVWLEEHGNFEV